MKVSVLTVSDSAFQNRQLDKSGPLLVELLQNSTKFAPSIEIVNQSILPDEKASIIAYLTENSMRADCILTTGGTGLAERDVTPEATKAVVERECPGIVTALLVNGLQFTPLAALSRLNAGTVGKCLIVNLPGNPKAVQEGFNVLEDILPHAVSLLKNRREEIANVHAAIPT